MILLTKTTGISIIYFRAERYKMSRLFNFGVHLEKQDKVYEPLSSILSFCGYQMIRLNINYDRENA